MKFLTAILTMQTILIFGTANFTHAQQSEKQIQPSSYKVTGRGIQDSDSGEIILLACVGESLTNDDLDCGILRLLQLKPGSKPAWLGNSFYAGELIQINKELSKWYSEKSLDGLFSSLKGDTIFAFTDKNGWNWSNNPLQIQSKKFGQVVSSILYFAEYYHSKDADKDAIALKQGIQGYRGVFVSQVKERGSKRVLIYSTTQTQMIISLFELGKITELKALPLQNEAYRIQPESVDRFPLMKTLAGASGDAYSWCFTTDWDNLREWETVTYNLNYKMVPAASGTVLLGVGILVTLPLCAVLPGMPFLAGLITLPADGIITIARDVNAKINTKAVARRKFSSLMDRRDLRAKSSVFNSLIEQIKEL